MQSQDWSVQVRRAAIVFGVLTTLAYSVLGQWMLATGSFEHFNRLFDTDPQQRLGDIASGWSSGASIHWTLPHTVHPLLPYLFSPFVRAFAWVANLLPIELEPVQVRQVIGVCVVPAMSGVAATLVCLMAGRLGLHGWRLWCANLLFVFAFSNSVFGSIPDDKALTRAASILLFFVLLLSLVDRSSGVRRRLLWAAAAVFAIGITITNAFLVFATRLASEWSQRATTRSALARAMAYATAWTVPTAGIGLAIGVWQYGPPEQGVIQNYAGHWLEGPTGARLASLLSAVGEAWLPLEIVDHRMPGTPWSVLMLRSGVNPDLMSCGVGLLVLALTLWGLRRLLLLGRLGFWLGICAVLQFLYVGLFAVWGDSPFLYSQHWVAAQQVMLIGLFAGPSGKGVDVAGAAALLLTAGSLVLSTRAWAYVVQAAPHLPT